MGESDTVGESPTRTLRAWHQGRRNAVYLFGGFVALPLAIGAIGGFVSGEWVGSLVFAAPTVATVVLVRYIRGRDWVELESRNQLTVARLLGTGRYQLSSRCRLHPRPWMRRWSYPYLWCGRRRVNLVNLGGMFDFYGPRRGDFDELMSRLEELCGEPQPSKPEG